MFTNWLTGTTGLTNSTTSSTHRLHESNQPPTAVTVPPPGLPTLLNTNSVTNLHSNIITSPPDIILEVGPSPSTIRFMAHAIVLGMHSGYLRSATRLDERSNGGSGSGSTGTDIIVYLTNVTPEQFAPLLTYMYTGYLDLNVENIFGVLLATHVLHMPRALEICRSYLARAQAEGYFGATNNNSTNSVSHQSLTSSGKIIRPIASKPQLANFGFLPIAHPLGIATTTIPNSTITTTSPQETKCPNNVEECNKSEEDIEVDELDRQSVCNENHLKIIDDDEEEDVELFIDSTSEAEVVVEMEIQKLSFKKLVENKKSDKDKEVKSKHDKPHHHHHHHKKSHKSERRRKSSSGLQVAKAPIPASQLDTSEANKVIIDVASCDGPVRFKRILNTAYGHKPDACSSPANHVGMSSSGLVPGQERSLQSVSLSFHQQMAKTISQQQHQLHQAEESENSETSNGSNGAGGGGGGGGGTSGNASVKASGSRKIQSEIFVCVYCKHTFKSQYCYQKHAKRHLNPLTLQATCVPEGKREPNEELCSTSQHTELQITKHQNISTTHPIYIRNSTHFPTIASSLSPHQQQSGQPGATTSSLQSTSDYLRREVRPLDMNVQYYPCKTCGSKFPSYYFVHKHRKMCHAEEEAAAAQQNSDNRGDNTTTSSAIVMGGVNQEEECMNSKNSD